MFQGNNVVNQSWETALFNDLGSSPATMEGSRAADLFGCAPGNDIMRGDAPGAYCQTDLLGTETWACLPPEARPASWSQFKWPVVRLKKALYGHPDSGTWWEQHADRIIKAAGFEPLPPEWPSCYFCKELSMFLIIYVDDFKLAGK